MQHQGGVGGDSGTECLRWRQREILGYMGAPQPEREDDTINIKTCSVLIFHGIQDLTSSAIVSICPYMFPRVFGDEFGDEFGDSLNLVINLVTNSVMNFVNH